MSGRAPAIFPSWVGPIRLAVGAGIAFFLAARLSLAVLTEPNIVAALLAVSVSALALVACTI